MKTFATVSSDTFPFSVSLEVTDEAGQITESNLGDLLPKKEADLIEAIILAHARAGVDVSSPEYTEGLETVLDSLGCSN